MFRRRPIQILLAEAVLPLIGACRPRVAYGVLELLGRVHHRMASGRRRAVAERVRELFGPLSPTTLSEAVRGLFVNALAMRIGELPLSRVPSDELASFVTLDGRERLDEALRHGRGCLLLGSHAGHGLVICHVLRRLGYPLVRVGVPPGDGRLLRRMAAHADARLHAETGPRLPDILLTEVSDARPLSLQLKRIYSALRANRAVYTAGDGLLSTRAVPAPLLGRSVGFPAGWVSVARLSGAPVIPAFMARRYGSAAFRGRFEAPIPRSLMETSDPAPAVEAYARLAEAHLRRHPCHAVTLVLERPSAGTLGASWDAAFRVVARHER